MMVQLKDEHDDHVLIVIMAMVKLRQVGVGWVSGLMNRARAV